ncbi:hypothetical protein FSP39_017282 [Pinctada imbricata]|uniref:Death domain-containing protein n=1 Tax=Pinctada imbricata TaxID=66713 RepID=A0AA88XZK9_PINIB|nr:hypothetical protein FSP39_017282 [Pinctada imbricata]
MASRFSDLEEDACPSNFTPLQQPTRRSTSSDDDLGPDELEITSNIGDITISNKKDGSCTQINLSRVGNLQIGNNNVMVINQSKGSGKSYKSPKVTASRRPQSELTGSKARPSHKDLLHASQNVGKRWCKLGRTLGLTDQDIEQVEYDYNREGLSEVVWQMLQKWIRKGRDVTVHRLALALYDVGREDAAFRLPVPV